MEDTIFSFEGIVRFCQTHFSDPNRDKAAFQLKDHETEQLVAAQAKMRAQAQPTFGFIVDLTHPEGGPGLLHPFQHQTLYIKPDLLDFRYFIKSIHPDYRQAYLWFGEASYMTIQHPEVRKMLHEGLDLRYVFALPLCKDIDLPMEQRKYEWWQQSARILRLGPNNILQAHLNQYQYLSTYQSVITQKGAIFSDIVSTGSGQPEANSLFAILKTFMVPAFMEALPANEQKIAKAHLAGCQTIREVGQHSGYPTSTVRTYQSRLLKRINPPFPLMPGMSFTTLKGAFQFLQQLIA